MKLVFVYNADSGVFNTLSDIAHKLFSPHTYACNLCNLTHGYFSERQAWREFLSGLDVELQFLHRDEFLQQAGVNETRYQFPAIYAEEAGSYRLWMGSEQINRVASTDELIAAIRRQLGR